MARISSKRLSADYELKRKNPITLGDDSFIDSHLKPIKVDSKNSILELSDNELKVRGTIDASAITVGGASVQTGTDAGATQLSELSDVAYSSGDLTITSLDTIVAGGDLTLDVEGDITLDATGGDIIMQDTGLSVHKISQFTSGIGGGTLKLFATTNQDDIFQISITEDGVTTISTVDDDTAVGHLTLQPDGDLVLDPVSTKVVINATDKLLFDGGTDTYITESSADVLDIYVGALNIMKLDEANDKVEIGGADLEVDAAKKIYLDGGGDTYIHEASADLVELYVGADKIAGFTEATTGNVADFGTTGVGFTQFEPTYNATDTNVNFNDNGNKAFCTFGAGNITDMNLYFPNVSCNCVLLLKQDGTGSRTVTNWKTFDQADGNESTVVWSGGSNPTLTTAANKLDILSFYWDNDNHKAYGVATLNF